MMVTIHPDAPLALAVVKAIHSGDTVALKQILHEHPELATARIGDIDGVEGGMSRTLLHVATDWPGHFPNGAATVAILVAAGTEVNARFIGAHTETALHWAASNDDIEVLNALVAAGADIEADGGCIAGGTPLTDARAFAQWNAAHRLVQLGANTTLNDTAALGLLERTKHYFAADTHPSQIEVNTAFWSACHGGQQQCAEYLLDKGAELNWLPDWEELTPLDAANRSNASKLVQWLRLRGAKSASDLR